MPSIGHATKKIKISMSSNGNNFKITAKNEQKSFIVQEISVKLFGLNMSSNWVFKEMKVRLTIAISFVAAFYTPDSPFPPFSLHNNLIGYRICLLIDV